LFWNRFYVANEWFIYLVITFPLNVPHILPIIFSDPKSHFANRFIDKLNFINTRNDIRITIYQRLKLFS
jgi:hypothetical protein